MDFDKGELSRGAPWVKSVVSVAIWREGALGIAVLRLEVARSYLKHLDREIGGTVIVLPR